ncbi:uncharacterized protein LOC131215516, partial [Anopheles bellator]|uniref:uncharacterized protein LOC131215516 n=1 Tax=Anopheles bellator TaxID=139047 RepID=UPI0026496DE9
RESRNNFHKTYDRSWEKWEKFREKKMEMMKTHKYNVEHRLKYDNQERILYRHHFNYYPVKRPRPRKTSLDPNWYTENIYSNQSIDNSDGEHAGMGTAFGGSGAPPDRHRDINGNVRLGGLEDDGIFTIDGHLERRSNYPKSSSCCFATNRMWDIEEGDGLELDDWHERYPKIPKSYSFSTSRSMGVGFNMAKLYNRNSFEMPEFPSHRRRPTPVAPSSEGAGRDPRTDLRMCDREGCFNETCFSKDEKNFYNNNSNIISEWNLRNRNNLRVRAEPSVAGSGTRVMEEDFDLFDEDEDEVGEEDEEEESDLNTLYAEDRHSIAYGDYGRMERDFCPRTPSGRVDELFRAERSKQLLRSKFDRVAKYSDDFTDDYRKSFEDFFNQNCCIERHHGQLKDSGRFFNKPSVVKNKSMLEVKPPNRFDDSSSGSTDLELDDFNFDFEKYWEELEKPSPTSPSELEERYGGKEGRSALAAPGRSGKKVKNVNLSRCYNNGTVIDIYHDDDPYHRDHYHYREGGLHGASKATNHAHNANNNNSGQFRLAHQFGHANTTPRSKGSRHKVFPAAGGREPSRPEDGDEDGLLDGATRKSGPQSLGRTLDPSSGTAINNNSNAISFLNNIFSIYKPNKYSPLNCHVEQNYLKNIPAKKMNIVASSAARPLGARGAEAAASDTSSTKRPLTVHPAKTQTGGASSAGARRSARPLASTKDPQARFQIIPDKTGVKISPLYRLDAQDYRRARYKLKSTSRPLSFW